MKPNKILFLKFIVILPLLLLASGISFAQETSSGNKNKAFFGAQLNATWLRVEVVSELNDKDTTEDNSTKLGSGLTFIGGYRLTNVSFSGAYSTAVYEGKKTTSYSVLVDWVPDSWFYLGGGAGVSTLEWTEDLSVNAPLDGVTVTYPTIIFQVGGRYDLTENIELDYGYRTMGILLNKEIDTDSEAKVSAVGGNSFLFYLGFRAFL